jgi:hypothetical protein
MPDKAKPPISQGLRLESPTDDPVTTPTHGRQDVNTIPTVEAGVKE